MKKIIAILTILAIANGVLADSLCDQSLQQGISLYGQGQYKEALECLRYANNRCPSSTTMMWISKCEQAMKSSIKTQNTSSGKSPKSVSSTPNTYKKVSRESKSTTQNYAPKSPATLVVSQTTLNFSNNGDQKSLIVTCNKEWGFTYLYKDANHQSRSYDFNIDKEGNTLIISCTSNPYTSMRTAQFNIFVRENKTIRYTIYLSQYAGVSYYIIASADGNEFYSNGGVSKVTVSTNSAGWYIDSKSSWLGYRNKTNNSIEIYCNDNKTSSELSGYVTFKTTSGNKSTTLYFRQRRPYQSLSLYDNKKSPSDEYFWNNGDYTIKWANVSCGIGYPFNFDMSIIDFRAYWFDFSLLNFGVQTDYGGSYNWYWQPNIGVSIPINGFDAIRFSIGPKYNFRRTTLNLYDDQHLSDYDLTSYGYYRNDRFGLNKDWWFNIQIGYVLEWADYFNSEFFIRYNGCVAIGATINIHTDF